MLTLLYITNNPQVACIAQDAGVDRVFVDMEHIGKAARQGGMDTVQNAHTLADVAALRAVVDPGKLLVRVNPIHEANPAKNHLGSQAEIEGAIEAGADTLMLPYFKTAEEVRTFLQLANGRARTMLLLETPEAAQAADEILALSGIDEIYIGLNDLSLGLGQKFMFQPLAEGLVDQLAAKFNAAGIPFGFGGIASLDGGAVPGRNIITEHYRLGSTAAILSRSFCNTQKITDLRQIREIFTTGIQAIRALEAECERRLQADDSEYFAQNRLAVQRAVWDIVRQSATAPRPARQSIQEPAAK